MKRDLNLPPGAAVKTDAGYLVNASGRSHESILFVTFDGLIDDITGNKVVESDYSIAYFAINALGDKQTAEKSLKHKHRLFP